MKIKSTRNPQKFLLTAMFALVFVFPLILSIPAQSQTRLVSQSVTVEISSDGTYKDIWENECLNLSNHPIESHTYRSSMNLMEKVLDGQGRELEVTVVKEPSGYITTIHFQEPVQPNEGFTFRIIQRSVDLKKKGEHVWVYQKNHIPGPETDYTESIKLPPGARVIWIRPRPTKQSDEEPINLVFERHLKAGEAFHCLLEFSIDTTDTEK